MKFRILLIFLMQITFELHKVVPTNYKLLTFITLVFFFIAIMNIMSVIYVFVFLPTKSRKEKRKRNRK